MKENYYNNKWYSKMSFWKLKTQENNQHTKEKQEKKKRSRKRQQKKKYNRIC